MFGVPGRTSPRYTTSKSPSPRGMSRRLLGYCQRVSLGSHLADSPVISHTDPPITYLHLHNLVVAPAAFPFLRLPPSIFSPAFCVQHDHERHQFEKQPISASLSSSSSRCNSRQILRCPNIWTHCVDVLELKQ